MPVRELDAWAVRGGASREPARPVRRWQRRRLLPDQTSAMHGKRAAADGPEELPQRLGIVVGRHPAPDLVPAVIPAPQVASVAEDAVLRAGSATPANGSQRRTSKAQS